MVFLITPQSKRDITDMRKVQLAARERDDVVTDCAMGDAIDAELDDILSQNAAVLGRL